MSGLTAPRSFVAFTVPLGEQLFVFGGALAGVVFFFLDLSGFGLQFDLGGFDVLVARLGIDHQVENLVLVGADFLLGELDLVHQGLVLVVGFHGQRLVAELRNLALQVLDGGFVLLAGSFVGLGGGFGLFQLGLGRCQLVFDYGDALGQRSHLFLQAQDFLVGNLQFHQVLDVLQHEDISILACRRGEGLREGGPESPRAATHFHDGKAQRAGRLFVRIRERKLSQQKRMRGRRSATHGIGRIWILGCGGKSPNFAITQIDHNFSVDLAAPVWGAQHEGPGLDVKGIALRALRRNGWRIQHGTKRDRSQREGDD